MSDSNFIAADFGAGSGRVIIGTLLDNKINLKEVHRFDNIIIEGNEHIYWDLDYLFSELLIGLTKVGESKVKNIIGIGIDTWGVDYALYDYEDKLLNNPIAYRDARTNGIMEEVFEIYSKEKIYLTTGIQFLQFNTLYQLFSEIKSRNSKLTKANFLLFLPDVLNYLLTGNKKSEYTIASTSQMLNANKKDWDEELLTELNIPKEILPEIIMPGNFVGKLLENIKTKTNLSYIDVRAVGSHDTASAIAAVPVQNKNWAYLSSGTWSLLGIEITTPIINKTSFEDSFTNEGGVEGTIRFLKNTMGLWILEQSIKSWETQGNKKSYDELFKLASEEKSFISIIDPDDQSFLNPTNMITAIEKFCKITKQKVPETQGQFVRCILESLALKYNFLLNKINNQIEEPIEVLHIIGGGSQNELLNQFTANAIGIPVIAGPVEATAIGNILVQAIAKKKIKSLQDGRRIVKNSFPLKKYLPKDSERWIEAYKNAIKIFQG
ncbi:MAG: rhamnulokinase [Ignavibacteriae bacterium]|nr:rhamnulokinase [Ignavibacteriota bacterium]